MNRRTVLKVLGSAAAILTANAAWGAEAAPDVNEEAMTLDAGSIDAFEQDKVYEQFRDQGVLLIRRGDEVFAVSPICTHRGCKVRAQDDNSFLCKCHKSRFDPDGKVLNGPAVADLLRLKVKLSAYRHVLVRVLKPKTTG